MWTGLAISITCCGLRLWARVRFQKRLLSDDYFVAFALVLAIVYTIMLQILAGNMYYTMEVWAGLKLPVASFASTSERWLKGSVAFILLYYSILWSIKISFLLWFKRLGKNVAYQKTLWWTIFVFTIAAYILCIGLTNYTCRTESFEYIAANCDTWKEVSSDLLVAKLNCAWDVITDFLSTSFELFEDLVNTFHSHDDSYRNVMGDSNENEKKTCPGWHFFARDLDDDNINNSCSHYNYKRVS